MPDYVELHAHSNFSLLDGASHPEDLAARAAALNMDALALTDHNAVYGAVRFVKAAQAHGVRPLLGAELTLCNGHHLTLLVENQTGWGNLCRLISLARHNAGKGEAALPVEQLANHTAGLIALSGCKQGEIAARLLSKDWDAALTAAHRYRAWFGRDNFWIELQHHLLPEDDFLTAELVDLAGQVGLNYVATNNVHYAQRAGRRLQDVLVCIRHQTSLEQAGPYLRPNSEFYLKPAARMAALFAGYPDALTNTRLIAGRCQFELQYGLQDLPAFPTPPGLEAMAYLRRLCQAAISERYGDPPLRLYEQLEYELQIIDRAKLANYFLIVWDIIRFARRRQIRCQGRGSAANSLVAYLLYISPIDPLVHDLVFERFLSAERQVVPDIDLDFDAERREEVIQYVYHRYGAEHTAMACTVVTFRSRSAVRDVGRALGLSPEVISTAGQSLETDSPTPPTLQTGASPTQTLITLCRQLSRFPRHLGIHNGGMVITGAPLAERVPTEPAAMVDRVVVQWDKDALEEIGLVKIDLLGLRMLSAIAEAVTKITAATGRKLDLDQLTPDDPLVYQMIAEADTIGVFQVESRAQAQMLPRLQPRCFNDLIVAISLIRPGPIQGNMVHPYLRRRLKLEPVAYLHPRLEPALAETLGVILFQEQVLKVARDLAGLTPGQGEQLRRAMSAKQAEAEINRFHSAFIAGAQAQGVPAGIAEAVFEQLRAFGGYAFAKSHAAAFSILVYQSAWLKYYYPAFFLAGLLNNQPMGFWRPAVLIGDARRHGLQILSVDINLSQVRCTVEQGQVRLGLSYVKGLGEDAIRHILTHRAERPFTSLTDFCRRTRLTRRLVENLIVAGAMDGWGQSRRRLLWELSGLDYRENTLALDAPLDDVSFPELTQVEKILWEQQILGLSTGEHVMTLYRAWLEQHGILGSRQLAGCHHGQQVQLAGLLVVRQSPPTAKGVVFLTLEDEDGLMNVIVYPHVVKRYQKLLHAETLLIVTGEVQRGDGVVDILASQINRFPLR